MSKPFDFLVFIGRFQPFHAGHLHVVKKALEQSDTLIIVIGSHDKPRDPRNPFTTGERMEIITRTLSTNGIDMGRIKFAPQVDYTYNEERWIAAIQASVESAIFSKWVAGGVRVGIVGYDKDHTTYYLKKFPTYELVEIEPTNNYNATDVRNMLFAGADPSDIRELTNTDANDYIRVIVQSSVFKAVKEEYRIIELYKEQWKNVPYPVTFVTVDAVVTQAGHVLLVQRAAHPGKGLWALPGGFIGPSETLREATIRELQEETRISVPVPVLNGSVFKEYTYDSPNRSLRGRTITHATQFKLNDVGKLPKVKGSDDARAARWVPFSEFAKMRSKMFEDHFSIVEHMLGL